MSDGKKYYCFCSSNCKYETMTKEQILTAIAAATGSTSIDADAAFITKVKEKNGGRHVSFWVGTQNELNALKEKEKDCLYIVTDDTIAADMEKRVKEAEAKVASLYSVDVTEKVGIEFVPNTGSMLTGKISDAKFSYNAALGIVHFAFSVDYEGVPSDTDSFFIKHKGKYKPSRNAAQCNYPVICDNMYVRAKYAPLYSDAIPYDAIMIDLDMLTAGDAIASPFDDPGTFSFYGWYFCDGE